jgi:glutathione synthase/RimK-type ligase-like ATP-grasp enzyme
MTQICILTPDSGYESFVPRAEDEFRALLGESVRFQPWIAPLSAADTIILPLLAWGYQSRGDDWSAALDAWEAAGMPIANPVPLMRWNTDKRYLFDLEAKGVPVIPTVFAPALSEADIAEARARFGDTVIVKPPVSGGADGTYRLAANDPLPNDVRGKPMLIQPMMAAIATEGEYSLFYFGGAFSHAILKVPSAGDFRVQEQFGGREITVEAPTEARAVAQQALRAAPGEALYARIDMVRGADGGLRLMELELIEPALFLSHAPDGGKLFADALSARLTSAR